MKRCGRCGGIMLQDVLEDVGIPLHALHCVACGNWIDSLILHHRTLTVLPEPSKPRTTIFDGVVAGSVNRSKPAQ